MAVDTSPTKATQQTVHISDRAKLRSALKKGAPPLLIHLNADTTWLLSLPYPPSSKPPPPGRMRFNVLIDPWLQGSQSDLATWFSRQTHIVAPSVKTLVELNDVLREAEGGDGAAEANGSSQTRLIDVVAISHEFTDHCHEATLKELSRSVPVFATDKAAELIRSWKHFDTVITTPGFLGGEQEWRKLRLGPLPSWLGIGRVITAGNALYYHSAIMVVFEEGQDSHPNAVIYSPHGIKAADLTRVKASGIKTLALLHGLHDVSIWMTKQLNLGALNGLEAVRSTGASYWIGTHDEVKKGGGFIAPLLRRTEYTVADAVKKEAKSLKGDVPDYRYVELGSGESLVLV